MKSGDKYLAILAAVMLVAAFGLCFAGHDGTGCVALLLGAVLALAAGMGAGGINKVLAGKDGFEISRGKASPGAVEQSIQVASGAPQIPAQQVQEITERAGATVDQERADTDYLVLCVHALRERNLEAALRYGYGGLILPSSGSQIRATLLLRIATVWGELGRDDNALELCAEADVVAPEFAWVPANRAIYLQRLGRLDEALAACDEAIERDSKLPSWHSNRGALLGRLGRYEEALEACDVAIALAPNNSAYHVNRGLVLYHLSRYADAEAAYLRAIDLEPSNHVAHQNLAAVLSMSGRDADAQEALAVAKALKLPASAEVDDD